jgi:hypothetical protein
LKQPGGVGLKLGDDVLLICHRYTPVATSTPKGMAKLMSTDKNSAMVGESPGVPNIREALKGRRGMAGADFAFGGEIDIQVRGGEAIKSPNGMGLRAR